MNPQLAYWIQFNRDLHAFFRNPPVEWLGTPTETRYHRRGCAKRYAYLRGNARRLANPQPC